MRNAIAGRARWVAMLAATLAFGVIGTAIAVHDAGLFELEGDAQDDLLVGGADWDQVYNDSLTPGLSSADAAAIGFISGAREGPHVDKTYWKGGGSKDVRDLGAGGATSTFWEHSATDSAPDTDDIQDAFAAAYSLKSGSNNDLVLYYGMDRFDTNGSSQVGFWFFKSKHALNPNGTFSGKHDVGDILILSDFTTGGRISNVKAYRWVGTGGDTGGTLDSLGGGATDPIGVDCKTENLTNDIACATVNSASVPSPWNYVPKGATGDSNFAPGAFFEGGINVHRALEAATGTRPDDICFSQFLAETRSSGSAETAQLKDFAIGDFSLCDLEIDIQPSAVNEVNDNHTFTVSARKKVGGAVSPLDEGQVSFTLKDQANADQPFNAQLSTCDDADDNLDANGQCTIVFTSSTPKTITGSASVTATLGTETLFASTNGTSPNSAPAVKHFVDAAVAIAPNDVNEVGESHTFTVTVTPKMPSGATRLSVQSVAVTPSVSPAPSSMTDTCGRPAPQANGTYTCTVTISHPTAQTFIANASATVTYAFGNTTDSVSRSTSGNSGPGASGPAIKRFVDASITISPDDTNGIGEPHTFNVVLTPHAQATTVSGVSISTTVSPAPGTQSSTCGSPTPQGNGTYTCAVTINSQTAGAFTANASATLTLTDAGGNSDTLTRDTSPATANVGSGPSGSGPAVKTYIAGTLVWKKHDQAGDLLGGATFRVCQTHTFVSATGTLSDIAADCTRVVTDNTGLDADDDAGEFKLVALPLGTYAIEETQAPPGYAKDDTVRTVTLTIANPDNSVTGHPDGIPVFVNVKLYKLIVITCNESLNTLEDATVTLGAGASATKETITAVPAHLAAKLVNQADLCDIGGASYGGLDAGTYQPSVELPDLAPLFP